MTTYNCTKTYIGVHGSIIDNSPKVEMTQNISVSWGEDKENVVIHTTDII